MFCKRRVVFSKPVFLTQNHYITKRKIFQVFFEKKGEKEKKNSDSFVFSDMRARFVQKIDIKACYN